MDNGSKIGFRGLSLLISKVDELREGRTRSSSGEGRQEKSLPEVVPDGKSISRTDVGSEGERSHFHPQSGSKKSRKMWFWLAIVLLGGIGALLAVDFSKYVKPPVSENRVLSLSEARWCLREGINIGVARAYAKTSLQKMRRAIMIEDYIARCRNNFFPPNILERAQRDIDQERRQIILNALRDFRI